MNNFLETIPISIYCAFMTLNKSLAATLKPFLADLLW